MRVVFHVDVNSAFLSWEAARRTARGEADIRLIPAVIAGDPRKRTSIVTAKSIPAKQYGIQTGEPVSMALRKCPTLLVVKPDFAWYRRCSQAFMAICRTYSQQLQPFSIDECFLEMTDRLAPGEDPAAVATRLKNEIRTTLGFTVNVGVGPNKLLAKMAGEFEKPDRVHTVTMGKIPQKIWPLPVRDLLFVGGKTEEKLARAGIYTIGDLAREPLSTVCALLGQKFGNQLHRYANGIDDSPVETEREENKSISVEHTFEHDLSDFSEAAQQLRELCFQVGRRLRAAEMKAFCVAVVCKTSEFKTFSRQGHLRRGTDISMLLFRQAETLLAQLWSRVAPIRLLGVALSDLRREEHEQLTLFPEDEHEEAYRVLDSLYDDRETKRRAAEEE